MAELDDGEMWLPSDMFPADEMTITKFQPNIFSYCPPIPQYNSRCFAAYDTLPPNLLHRRSTREFFGPPVRSSSLLPGGGGSCASVTSGAAVYNYDRFLIPVQPQIEMLRREGRMYMARGEESLNLGIGGGVFGFQEQRLSSRECRAKGTGVFIPRTSPMSDNIFAPTHTHGSATANISGRHGITNNRENKAYSLKNSMKRFDTTKEVECHYHLPPEMDFPKEWTY